MGEVAGVHGFEGRQHGVVRYSTRTRALQFLGGTQRRIVPLLPSHRATFAVRPVTARVRARRVPGAGCQSKAC